MPIDNEVCETVRNSAEDCLLSMRLVFGLALMFTSRSLIVQLIREALSVSVNSNINVLHGRLICIFNVLQNYIYAMTIY